MEHLSTLLALLMGIAGWYYLFYSKAAQGLTDVEDQRLNRQRLRLRRAGGFVLLLLAPLFFAGVHTVNSKQAPAAFIVIWFGVLLLLGLTIVFALVDVRLTLKLRSRYKQRADR